MARASTFAELLDDIISSAETAGEIVRRLSIPFDMLQAGGADGRINDPVAAAEYLFSAADRFEIAYDAPPLVPEMPSTVPLDIALELGLTGRETAEMLDRVRRDFAFANHPDRVSADLRDVAMVRMQIANRMIDDAKKRLSRR